MKKVITAVFSVGKVIVQGFFHYLSPIIVTGAVVWHLFLTDINYFDICRNDDKIRDLQHQIEHEKALISQLREEIRDSKSDAATIDRIAREKHGMQRTHEDVYVTILPPDTIDNITKD